MKLKEKLWQHRRDFVGIYECESCKTEKEINHCYDDANFHNNVTPKWECDKCGESSVSLGIKNQVPLDIQRDTKSNMTIKEFIDKAIEGGWSLADNLEGNSHLPRINEKHVVDSKGVTFYCDMYHPRNKEHAYLPATFYMWNAEVLLDPKAWEAVGKVERWTYDTREATLCDHCKYFGITVKMQEWKHKMHRMIKALIEGKTIEEYLETL